MPDIVYFDNSATTCIYPKVLSAMNEVYLKFYGNPSSLHKMGNDADKLMQKSRQMIANTLNVSDNCIFFTSGGTESNNWAIKGTALANRRRGNNIITSKTEHPSVLECFKYLETEDFCPNFLEVDSNGLLIPDTVAESVNDKTILLSFVLVNNETGAVQKVEEIVRAARIKNPKIIIHVDAVQAYGKIPLNLSRIDIDLVTISSHKIHGPKGCGALYIKRNTHILPVLHGGGQEKKYRSGTENVPAIYGFAVASEIINKNIDENRKNAYNLKRTIIEGLLKIFGEKGFFINSPEGAYEGILNISFPRVKAQVLMQHLETKNIFVSVGSACSSRKNLQSHVLSAMNLPKENIEGAIRLSFSGMNTTQEALRFIEAVKEIIPKIKY